MPYFALQHTVLLLLNRWDNKFPLLSWIGLRRISQKGMVVGKLLLPQLTASTESSGMYHQGLELGEYIVPHRTSFSPLKQYVLSADQNLKSTCSIVWITLKRLASWPKWRRRFQKSRVLWWKTLKRYNLWIDRALQSRLLLLMATVRMFWLLFSSFFNAGSRSWREDWAACRQDWESALTGLHAFLYPAL